jgi:hypothetical protein
MVDIGGSITKDYFHSCKSFNKNQPLAVNLPST